MKAIPGENCPCCGQRVPHPGPGQPRGDKPARVVALTEGGLSDEEIGTALGIGVATVREYRRKETARPKRTP